MVFSAEDNIKAKSSPSVITLVDFVHSHLSTTGTHVSYGITQFNLTPYRGDVPAITTVEAGTRFRLS